VAGHYIENTGEEDLVFLETFKTSRYSDFSLNQWIRRLPEQIISEHLHLDSSDLKRIPDQGSAVTGD
jgi:oxalate decarboxylase